MPNTNTDKACPPLNQYQQLASGQLSDFEKESLLSHLECCDACAQKLKTLPEPDTLVGLLRQADTLSEETGKKAIAGLVERLSKMRPEQIPAGARPQATAAGVMKADITIDLPPTDAAKKPTYEFLAPAQAPDEVGRLGPYRVLEVLGTGGMGVVFRAEDPQLARQVALKAMLPGFVASETARQRFLREARAAAAIKHDHIVSIYQVGEDRGVLYLAMELLDGEPLDARLQREGKLPVAEVLRIGRQIALGLAAAHKRGLTHRDIKPANVWLESETNRVKILDFGLARTTGDQAQLTQQGAIVGTPAYMAPEQGKGKNVDHRCDLFSLGCVLYRMATGAAPFSGTDVVSTLLSVATETPRSPQLLEPKLPRALSELIVSLLAKEAADRPASAQVVVEKLDNIAQELARPTPAKPRRRWPAIAAAAGFLALLAAGIVFYMQTPDGVVRIEIDDPEIKLAIEGHIATVTNADKQPITLKPGKHGLTITRGDFTFNTASFELPKRGKTALKITWHPGQKMVVMQDGVPIAEKEVPPVAVALGSLPPRYTNSLGMEFALMPKGKSWLGGGGGKPGDKEVEFKDDFYLGVYEVTQEEWEKVTGLKPSYFSPTGGGKDAVKDISDAELKRFPVESVSWADAQLFLDRLNKREQESGWRYRLPTEAEWEYACRGGPMADPLDSVYDYYFDKPTNQAQQEQGNYEHGKGLRRTCKVGTYKPNRLGLYDMHGNVHEWCDDWYDKDALQRVLRGGDWYANVRDCVVTRRFANVSSFLSKHIGLRVARVRVAADPDRRAVTDAWLKEVAALPPGEQVKAVAAKLTDLNPGFDGKVAKHEIEGRVVTSLTIAAGNKNVTDIAPLRALPGLREVHFYDFPLSDLSPLKDLKLTVFFCLRVRVTDLSPLKDMKLTAVHLVETPVKDLLPLKGMPVTHLVCVHTQVSDLTPLKGMPLQHLNCMDMRVSDLTPLKGMPLHYLNCAATQVSDLTPLQDMSGLHTLEIAGPKITDATFASLKKLTDLQTLSSPGTKVTDAGLVHLKGMVGLRSLQLSDSELTGAGLVHLKGLFRLRILDLKGTRLTDDELHHLAGLKNLELLVLNGTAVTAKGVAKLKADLPKCNITVDSKTPAP